MQRWTMGRMAATAALATMLAACGGDDEEGKALPISTETLTGTVGGEDFTAVGGLATEDAFEPGLYSIGIYNRAVACADRFSGNPGSYLLMFAPLASDTAYDFSLQKNATFVIRKDGEETLNDVALDGRFEVRELTDTTATVGLRMATGDSSVNGQVTLTRCEN